MAGGTHASAAQEVYNTAQHTRAVRVWCQRGDRVSDCAERER